MCLSPIVQMEMDLLNTIERAKLQFRKEILHRGLSNIRRVVVSGICGLKGYTPQQEIVATQDYYSDPSGKTPHYFQQVAINRTVDAIARGENRVLLVMATGTGKTYTAFQIIWRLWKAGVKKRILFLVDRNILADQTKINDFKPFGTAMTKITQSHRG